MKSRWFEADATAAVERYAPDGVNEDLALRVYTSRLLGADTQLVLHGGGNTSVKTTATDLLGRELDVICVKGSGWDLATIEPPGLPAVRLAPLRELASLSSLTDEAMVNAQRNSLLDSGAPNPSVETLLHAFLPHRFIDHTHADAVLALTDQPEGKALCREVYGDRVAILPYIAPGFDLSVAAKAAFEAHPDCEGMILIKHGIFTFGDTARDAYERMIDLVTLAEERLARGRTPALVAAPPAGPPASPLKIAPILRGLVARAVDGGPRRFVLDFRTSDAILDYVNGAELARYGQAGVVTPDHVIRIKPRPLIVPAPAADDLAAFADAARVAVDAYVTDYHAYFDRNNAGLEVPKIPLDPLPRVILVPGVGLFALGASAKAAAVAADLAETTVRTVTAAESIGRFESISEADTFAMEYWSLEQAKLRGGPAEGPLARHVVAITGGAGTIGRAIGRAFRAAGAEVALLDRQDPGAAAAEVGGLGVTCDVTDADAVDAALRSVCQRCGGLDVLVSNAGAAWQGRIGEVGDDELRASFELNFFAHQAVAKAATAIFLAQGIGGVLLFNISKQAVNPGPDFGPYGLPKAATLALMRQYAVDYGHAGIRANGVNADRIPSGILTGVLVAERARARGVSEHDYLAGNLLREPVRAENVARAFVDLALAERTTGAVITVDGGNIAAALR